MTYPPFAWPPLLNNGGGGGGGSTTAIILTSDVERWLDPDNGNDASAGTEAAPWLTFAPFSTLLATYSAIHAIATLHILSGTTIPAFASTTVPELGTLGKIVLKGEDVVENAGGTFVASAASTLGHVNTDLYPYAGDPRGWIIECVAGSNLNQRRLIGRGTAVMGGAAVLYPSAPFANAGIGDTYRLIRPAARLTFPAGTLLVGSGRGSVGFTGADPGVYVSNLQVLGAPSVQLTSLWLYGVEAFADATHPGCTFSLGDQTLVGAGQVVDAMPWIDPQAGNWNGCGLTQRYDTTQIVQCARLLEQLGPTCEVNGYICGVTWLLAQRAIASFFGGALWGQFEGEVIPGTNVIDVGTGAQMLVGVFDATIAVGLSATNGTPLGVVYVHDPDSVAVVGFVELISSDAPLLRATDCGTIDIDSNSGAPFGNSVAGDAQDATGAGAIVWDGQPALTAPAGAQLRVTGLVGTNAQLATAATALRDALNVSRIVRRATTTPATAADQQSPPWPPFNAGSIFCEVAAGVSVTAIPAPPAGFINVILSAQVKNDGAATAVGQLAAGATPLALASVNAGQQSVVFMAGAPYPAAAGAVTASRVSGTSTSLKFWGEYIQIPQANLLLITVVLTAAYQTVAAIVPPAGRVTRPWSVNISALTSFGWQIVNGDVVTHQVQWQITRGGVVLAFTSNVNATTLTRNAHGGNQFPTILPGDLVEVRTTEAITNAGTVFVTGLFELVPSA